MNYLTKNKFTLMYIYSLILTLSKKSGIHPNFQFKKSAAIIATAMVIKPFFKTAKHDDFSNFFTNLQLKIFFGLINK